MRAGLVRAIGVLLAGLVLIGACSGDGDEPATPTGDEQPTESDAEAAAGDTRVDDGIEIIDAGAEPRTVLDVGDPLVGEAWTLTVSYAQEDGVSADGASVLALSVDLFETIVDVDGEPQLRSQLVAVRMDPAMQDSLEALGRDPREVQAQLDELIGVRQEVALNGRQGFADQLGRLGVESVATAGLPTTPVGAGAKWTVESGGSLSGLSVEISQTVTVGSISPDTVELTIESSGSVVAPDGEEIAISGEGRSVLDRHSLQPLESSFSLRTADDSAVAFSQSIESARQ
jgi:hypothetical protein